MAVGKVSAEVAVLGAGLTGACAALSLARRGVDVALLEQDAVPMNRASLRNEGKIHLGFVFANDRSMRTPNLMLEGALSFRRVLAELTGSASGGLRYSTPFVYLVAGDSLVSPDELERRYSDIEASYVERLASVPGADYLGQKPETLFRRVPTRSIESTIRADDLAGAFMTEERAVDTDELALAVRCAIASSPRIRFLPGVRVQAVERVGARFSVHGVLGHAETRVDAGQVINALWEGRLRIDDCIGLTPAPGWVHRLKYRVIARIPDNMHAGPSATMVLGPYGDVVIRPGGTAFFSWYPVGLQGWSHALEPPSDWAPACRGMPGGDGGRAIAAAILGAIDRWYPGAASAEPLAIDAGAIVAYGTSDVHDPDSGLHDRSRVGVTSVHGYHSVEPGKLTTAPMFGLRAADAVLGEPRVACHAA